MLFAGNRLGHIVNGLLEAIASIPIGQQKRKPQPRAIKRRQTLPLINDASKSDLCSYYNYLINNSFYIKQAVLV